MRIGKIAGLMIFLLCFTAFSVTAFGEGNDNAKSQIYSKLNAAPAEWLLINAVAPKQAR